jgi:hypothetical protein
MFGNTHLIADAVAKGMAPGNEVTVIPVSVATRKLLHGADLVVAGGPTHVHGISKASTREAAVEQAGKSAGQLVLDVSAAVDGPGLRDWFGSLGQMSARGAAFDTRVAGPAIVTGHASKGIAKLLAQHGLTLVVPAKSFLVTRENMLQPGEEDRAREWGRELAVRVCH